jgi:acetyl-CoA carboxylase carboxyltransferase component
MSQKEKSWEEYLEDFEAKKAEIFAMGGEKAVAKQHERGKLTARERIDLFFDPGTFEEVDTFINIKKSILEWTKKRFHPKVW